MNATVHTEECVCILLNMPSFGVSINGDREESYSNVLGTSLHSFSTKP